MRKLRAKPSPLQGDAELGIDQLVRHARHADLRGLQIEVAARRDAIADVGGEVVVEDARGNRHDAGAIGQVRAKGRRVLVPERGDVGGDEERASARKGREPE